MDPRIIKFLKKHHVLTLATSRDNIPWASHCFYAFMEDEKALVFTTDNDTRHGQEMQDNQVVSGGIVLETKVVGMIRGVQLTGTVSKTQDGRRKTQDNTQHATRNTSLPLRRQGQQARRAYLSRFPYAILMKTNLWVLDIESIKFTDNRLGFGKKLRWEREL